MLVSDNSLWHTLYAIKPPQQKHLSGLDGTTAAVMNGFNYLQPAAQKYGNPLALSDPAANSLQEIVEIKKNNVCPACHDLHDAIAAIYDTVKENLVDQLRYSIFLIFPLPFDTFQIQKNKWKWNNL